MRKFSNPSQFAKVKLHNDDYEYGYYNEKVFLVNREDLLSNSMPACRQVLAHRIFDREMNKHFYNIYMMDDVSMMADVGQQDLISHGFTRERGWFGIGGLGDMRACADKAKELIKTHSLPKLYEGEPMLRRVFRFCEFIAAVICDNQEMETSVDWIADNSIIMTTK